MVIGLTGGIASGKSTVATMMAELGAVVIDADQIAREVVAPGQPTLKQIRETFGPKVILPNGELDRQKLGAIIFNDKESRMKLNQLIHPAIRKRMNELKNKALEEGESFIVMDIPLLFESNLEGTVDKILVVYVPLEIQMDRLIHRDQMAREEALARIQSQLSLEEKKEKGHAYLDNSGTVAETRKQLIHILKKWGIKK